MIIRLIVILFLPLLLNASKILSYNIYDRTDRADVMITFDTPYDGTIKQSTTKFKIIIKLQDANIESAKLKELSSKFLQSLSITPMSNYTQIVATVPSNIKLQASRTSDAYGLRLRFTNKVLSKSKNDTNQNRTLFSNLPTKKDEGITANYIIVISILIIGVLILLFLKKRLESKNKQIKHNSWLFKDNSDNQQKSININDEVTIRFQKSINNISTVVMLDFGVQSYLMLMGENNILLDKFTDNKPTTQEDFEQLLQDKHQELDKFLSTKDEIKEPLQAYKEKAASIAYEV